MSRFLLVTHIYPPAIDGGSTVIYKLGQYFQSQGHQIKVLSSDANSTDDFTRPYNKVNNLGLPVYTLFHRPLKLISKVLSKGPIFKIIPFLRFIILILRYHPDYIIAGPLPTTVVLYARFIKLITRNSKLIINASFHHTDKDFFDPLLINTLQSADYIWTLTDFETNFFNRQFHIPMTKMINLGNGIDKHFITNKPTTIKNKLIFIGSFAKHKNIEVLLEAFKLLPKNYSLTVAGKPTLHQICFPKNVKVITNFKPFKLPKLLDQCSVLISPSTQESFGLVLLEAMARGKPVIAADIPASHELIVKSQAGLLFKPNDPQDLANKILQIKNYSNKAISFASDRTWDKIGKSLWQKISSSSL